MTSTEPLSYRMCPRSLAEYVGHEEIIGEGKLLNRLISADKLSSMILWGPPGCGKTSLANVIARATKSHFEKLNATSAGVADIKRIISGLNGLFYSRVILLIEEIHRFNKAQQDVLLPCLENGSVILIGATTENPYFEVNKAILSRSTVFQLKPLTLEHIRAIIRQALADQTRGLGREQLSVSDEAITFLAQMSGGDARIALNALELAALTTSINSDGVRQIDLAVISDCIQKKAIRFDKSGEAHYDNISAFIKSMRGSDPDAAIFYLARALYAGEDPVFLARRIVICASEDVGLANPQALQVAVAASEAVHRIGMPEARIILAEAAILVAVSPKSNAAYLAIDKALDDVAHKPTGEVPFHLRNAVTTQMAQHGYGQGYCYPHDYPNHYVKQDYLPKEMVGTVYYQASSNGYERKIREIMEKREIIP